jgi:predicted branched-subunit amino acid permease
MSLLLDRVGGGRKSAGLWDGAIDSAPVSIAFIFLFAAIGSFAHQANFTLLQSTLMSALIYASPLQIFIIQQSGALTDLTAIITTSLLINFRFILMSASLIPYFKGVATWKKLIALPLLSASTFTVSFIKLKTHESVDSFQYFLGMGIVSLVTAVAATAIGYVMTESLQSQLITSLLHMILPIHFTALTANYWPNKMKSVIATAIGFLSASTFTALPNNYGVILGPVLVGVVMMIFDNGRKDAP